MDKNDEKNETRKNKEIIKRDYIKEMKKAEKYKFEEDIKQDIIKNIDKLDDPDIKNNEKIVDDRLSDIYDDAYQKENSEYEKKYLDELELYENAIKIKDLKDKLEYVKIKKIKGKEGEYDDYEYEIISNQEIKKAIEERNNMIKNGNVILKDNSPYSEIEDEEPEKNEEKEQSEEKSESISEYY